jgi:hypothetical protein
MSLRRFITRSLALFTRLHRCADGPMQGAALILSEHSPNSAWVEVRGEVGRYVMGKDGALRWEPAAPPERARRAGL